ncbi:hypothetical protein ACT7T5_003460 [Vibrio cholerae]|uniref:hypothetical protein n=1 Tax=Vibrio cholerae TaxID=666 RepID=UPI000F3AE22D|nr:hypothetical protein [Vibrio cholerae]RNE71326.1 hypothetical protein EEJ37_04035 [Vibrio cholerae]
MSYRNGVANTANDFFQVIQAFFNEQQPVDWELLYGSSSTPDRISIKHKTKDVVLAFLWYDSGVDCWHGMGTKTDGTWPGIKMQAPNEGRGGGGLGMTYPCRYHIACNQGGFIVALERESDGYCVVCGGGTWQKNDVTGDAGVWGSTNPNDYQWGIQQTHFLSGNNASYRRRCGFVAEFSPTPSWLQIGYRTGYYETPTNPDILPIFQRGGIGIYNTTDIEKTAFKLSATTVFMPVLFTRKQPQGWYVMGEVDWLRVCSTKYLSSGDSVNYNGKHWVVIACPTPGGVGIAVEI